MKFLVICFCFAFIAVVYSLPSGWPNLELEEAVWEPSDDLGGVRLKRASCDLFSFSSQWVTPNHAVCAAHCIVMGNRGGHCEGTICHCRK